MKQYIMLVIPVPNRNEVEKYIKKWELEENYLINGQSLNKLFRKTYTKNNNIYDILIKTSCLNDIYSTNIFSTTTMAKHICDLNIDERLERADETLVNDIANITIKEKKKQFYSFATKYCSYHKPLDFPIYDSYVEKVLMYFKRKDNFADFKKEDLKNYCKFKKVVIQFKKYYNIDEYNLRDIDKYIWLLGKKYFNKNISSKKLIK